MHGQRSGNFILNSNSGQHPKLKNCRILALAILVFRTGLRYPPRSPCLSPSGLSLKAVWTMDKEATMGGRPSTRDGLS